MKEVIQSLMIVILFSCGSVKSPPASEMPEWLGKTREEVKTDFTHLTPITEENKISYLDTDPIPTPARCAVIGCYPWTFGPRISCTYIFKFENDRVVKATRSGRCRN